jgi:hypothetical protein
LRLKLDHKSIKKLSERSDVIEEETSGEETDYEIEAGFAKLRGARARKTDAFDNKTYEDVWDNTTQEELDYYKQKLRSSTGSTVSNPKESVAFS